MERPRPKQCKQGLSREDDMTYKRFPHYLPFANGIHWSPSGDWCIPSNICDVQSQGVANVEL